MSPDHTESTGLPPAVARQFDPDDRRRLSELRRDLHAHPELAFEEHRTAERLASELERLEPEELHRVAGTGLAARIPGRDSSATPVAVRGDIDALPIQEQTGLDYSSQTPGVMHACGHDVHATWAIGAALLLRRRPARGDVWLILQPAEEIAQGAPAVLESGLLDEVGAIFAGHVDRRFAVGEAVVQAGPLAAAADSFEVVLVGQGGHGARPHLVRDPVVAAASLVQALQTVVSRRIDPGLPAVVTVGTLEAGTIHNVIPERARLTGTLRSTTPDVRRALEEELRHLVAGLATAHRVEAEVTVRPGTPPVVNDERATEWARRAAAELLGASSLLPLPEVNMGGEDFAFYLERIPGCFLRVGAREAGGEIVGAHTSRFYAAEQSVFVGAAVLAGAARAASDAL